MRAPNRTPMRTMGAWGALAIAVAAPIAAAAASPLLAWRDPIYIGAGLAGVIGLALLLVQPLLAGGYLPGLTPLRSRSIHGWVGGVLLAMVVVHVGGLWITSPPDVIDALSFTSPTPFSSWGVIAMWAVFLTAGLAAVRRRARIPYRRWRVLHVALALVIVTGTAVHALLIEGTMELVTKAGLCALTVAATLKVAADVTRAFRLRGQK